jgi:hypothetical protein
MKCLVSILVIVSSSLASADDLFSSKIEPLLKQRCFECHSHEQKIKGGLALDSKSGWEKGGESGPAIIPGKPEASLLIQAVNHVEKDLKMPPKKMLPASEIALLTEWVRQGAPDPRVAAQSTALAADDAWEVEFQRRLDWWSLKPMRHATSGSVDGFIQAAQKAAGLEMTPQASPEVLRRRLSFVLTGLPPSISRSDTSYESYVDELLNSPHFGEHFARHWMDVVRYTDTYGYEWDNPAKGSHEYRDYLIRAFNDDIGFDQLLREHLAGDLLPKPRIHAKAQTNESLIGPMFYHLGEHRHGSSLMFNGIHQEMVNNKIDAFSKAFLATTVACARCHDHKLEAVSQHDYYALAAMFTTPRWTSRVIDAPGKNDAAIVKLKDLRQSIRDELSKLWSIPFTADSLQQWAAGHKDALKGLGAPLATPADFPKMAATWQKSRETAQKANAAFKQASLGKWVFEGDGFTHGQTDDGTPLIALEGENVLAGLLPRGWHSHALSSNLPGSLRMPPQHLVPGKFVSLKLAGGEFGGHLVVDDHAFQNETIVFYTNTDAAVEILRRCRAQKRRTAGHHRVLHLLAESELPAAHRFGEGPQEQRLRLRQTKLDQHHRHRHPRHRRHAAGRTRRLHRLSIKTTPPPTRGNASPPGSTPRCNAGALNKASPVTATCLTGCSRMVCCRTNPGRRHSTRLRLPSQSNPASPFHAPSTAWTSAR